MSPKPQLKYKNSLKCIGLMSGTSMDGIDAAIIETDGQIKIKQLGSASLNYEVQFQILLKAAEYALKKNHGNLKVTEETFQPHLESYLNLIYKDNIGDAHKTLSLYLYGVENHAIRFSDIIKHSTLLHEKIVCQLLDNIGFKTEEVDLVGYHGQALYHNPDNGITIQVGDGQLLANKLGMIVINDFRSNDVKNGGQGAPLAPLYHQALAVRDNQYPIVVLNCGGIANITVITGEGENNVLGFDTGPGNVLVDQYIKIRTLNRETMDKDGKYGLKGKVNEQVLKILHAKAIVKNGNNYFDKLPPKSLDSGDANLISELSRLKLEDACATLEAFTAYTIADSLKFIKGNIPKKFVLAGGGWNNPVITMKLKDYLIDKLGKDIKIFKADELRWDSKYMEAELFAYLAARSFYGLPISYPQTTNARTPTLGGQIYSPYS